MFLRSAPVVKFVSEPCRLILQDCPNADYFGWFRILSILLTTSILQLCFLAAARYLLTDSLPPTKLACQKKIMKTAGFVPTQKPLDIVVRAFYASAAALSLGLLTLTPGVASAQIVEYEFFPSPSATSPTGVLYDNTANTAPGVLGHVGTVAVGSTFTTSAGTFDMDVGAFIEGLPQLQAGIGVNDDLLETVGGDNLILGNEQPPTTGPQLWELTTVGPGGLNGLIDDGIGTWELVQSGGSTNGGGGNNGNGGSGVPDGGSTLVLSLGSLTLLGAAARRFNRVSA
jgi:hypothetical protein